MHTVVRSLLKQAGWERQKECTQIVNKKRETTSKAGRCCKWANGEVNANLCEWLEGSSLKHTILMRQDAFKQQLEKSAR